MGHPVVTVRCSKGHVREIHPKEIPEGEIPVCDKDYKIMVPIQATSCECDWQPESELRP